MGSKKQPKIIYFTAIFGWYDNLKDPKQVNKNAKYICFCDRYTKRKLKNKCKVWKFKVVEPKQKTLRRENRYWKINSHITLKNYNYDISVYVDGRFQIWQDFTPKLERWLGNNHFALETITSINCSYTQAENYMKKNVCDKHLATKQIEFYKEEGFPKHYGLTANYFIIRRNSRRVNNVNKRWWKQIENFCTRDQVSFMYSLWKEGESYSPLPIPYQFTRKYKSLKQCYVYKRRHRIDFEETNTKKVRELKRIAR